jgi:hypothetical protein
MILKEIIEKLKEDKKKLKEIKSFDYKQGYRDCINAVLPDLEKANELQEEMIKILNDYFVVHITPTCKMQNYFRERILSVLEKINHGRK